MNDPAVIMLAASHSSHFVAQAKAVDAAGAATALRLCDEVRAMTWRLLHPRV